IYIVLKNTRLQRYLSSLRFSCGGRFSPQLIFGFLLGMWLNRAFTFSDCQQWMILQPFRIIGSDQ
ncbi:uncharacterized protein EI90DRAFT_3053976, partial [Cantharellus anzutake]|uniref:uncharacterized protein n=1 Tax=Cantharellus anzutake TaxID=1750568 RepID=UPI001907F2C1